MVPRRRPRNRDEWELLASAFKFGESANWSPLLELFRPAEGQAVSRRRLWPIRGGKPDRKSIRAESTERDRVAVFHGFDLNRSDLDVSGENIVEDQVILVESSLLIEDLETFFAMRKVNYQT